MFVLKALNNSLCQLTESLLPSRGQVRSRPEGGGWGGRGGGAHEIRAAKQRIPRGTRRGWLFAVASVGHQMVSETMSKHVTAGDAMRELLSALSACWHTPLRRSLSITDLVTIDFFFFFLSSQLTDRSYPHPRLVLATSRTRMHPRSQTNTHSCLLETWFRVLLSLSFDKDGQKRRVCSCFFKRKQLFFAGNLLAWHVTACLFVFFIHHYNHLTLTLIISSNSIRSSADHKLSHRFKSHKCLLYFFFLC